MRRIIFREQKYSQNTKIRIQFMSQNKQSSETLKYPEFPDDFE